MKLLKFLFAGMGTLEIMPENLKSKFVFKVFRESGISKFQEKMDCISKLEFDTHIWNRSEDLKFDNTNWMNPCRFREKQQATTKLYAKVHQKEGLQMTKYGPWQPGM